MDEKTALAIFNLCSAAAAAAEKKMLDRVPLTQGTAKAVLEEAREALSAEDRKLLGESAEARRAVADIERDLDRLALLAEQERGTASLHTRSGTC